jgi:hypothetical protein
MIIVLTEMALPGRIRGPDAFRRAGPAVEQFCRALDGCERFALSFPAERPCSPLKSGATPS